MDKIIPASSMFWIAIIPASSNYWIAIIPASSNSWFKKNWFMLSRIFV
jgi:hypothetical protein